MSRSIDCQPELLAPAVTGSLSAADLQRLEEHLNSCPDCQSGLERVAADATDWEKVSDYFSSLQPDTTSLAEQQTVDLQWDDSEEDPYRVVRAGDSDFCPIMESASHPELMGRIDDFDIEQVIGRGGAGVVYRGFDTELNRPVAIKVLAQHLAVNGLARQRFAREARAAAAVIHPNVVPIHSVNSSGSQPYLVMTLVAGRSLQAHIEQQGSLPLKEVVRIGRQIAAGLAAAHREGLVHRDIKPANILLEKDVSRVMITDFGLARAADDAAITQTGWLAGTPHYMSPEQASGREVDFRSDLFSLGSVLYFMASGREPFRAQIPIAVLQKINVETPISVRGLNSDISQTLANVIDRLMDKKPEGRFESAEEVETVLTQYLAHLEQPTTEPKPKVRKPRRRRALVPTLALALATLGLLAAAWNWEWIYTAISGNGSQAPAPSWPIGLQPIDSWQQELEQLQREVEHLENPTQKQASERPHDPLLQEQQRIQQTIDQLERLLQSSN